MSDFEAYEKELDKTYQILLINREMAKKNPYIMDDSHAETKIEKLYPVQGPDLSGLEKVLQRKRDYLMTITSSSYNYRWVSEEVKVMQQALNDLAELKTPDYIIGSYVRQIEQRFPKVSVVNLNLQLDREGEQMAFIDLWSKYLIVR